MRLFFPDVKHFCTNSEQRCTDGIERGRPESRPRFLILNTLYPVYGNMALAFSEKAYCLAILNTQVLWLFESHCDKKDVKKEVKSLTQTCTYCFHATIDFSSSQHGSRKTKPPAGDCSDS